MADIPVAQVVPMQDTDTNLPIAREYVQPMSVENDKGALDKLTEMNKEINTKITPSLDRKGFLRINLQYIDIRLDLTLDGNRIFIEAFSRGHHVRTHPEQKTEHRWWDEDEPASDPGDGSLFLALVVIRCNEIFREIVWISVVNDWWYEKGVCAIEGACSKTEISGHDYEINSKLFLKWSIRKIREYNKQKGGKKRYKRTRKKRTKRTKKRKPIKINPKMKGVFTRKAKKKGMSVQKYAAYIIKKYKGKTKNKQQLKLLRQAVFAKTVKKWKKGKRKKKIP